jgi:hypothetical protein
VKKVNKSFQAVAAQTRMVAPQLTHAQRVTRLYRKALRLQFSFAVTRSIFIEEADKIRAQFDKLKHAKPDSGEVKYAIADLEAKIETVVHPDPYCMPYMPGGVSF